jgi:hypothetical protein
MMDSGAQLGPGSSFQFDVDGGVNAGDRLFATLYFLPVGTGSPIISGTQVFNASHSAGSTLHVQGYFGVDRTWETFAVLRIDPMAAVWPAEGDSLYVHGAIIRGAGELVSDDTISFSWHGAAGVANLVYALSHLGGSADLTDIRNAVYRTFPAG